MRELLYNTFDTFAFNNFINDHINTSNNLRRALCLWKLACWMFTLTQRLKRSTSRLNDIDFGLVETILHVTIQKLESGERVSLKENIEMQITQSSKMSVVNVGELIEVCVFIFENAAYNNIEADVLRRDLHSVGLKDELCTVFARIWRTAKAEVTFSLLRNIVSGPAILHSFSWQVNMNIVNTNATGLRDPSAIFFFKVFGEEQERPDFAVRMSHSKLYDFFSSLELIQNQLDTLA